MNTPSNANDHGSLRVLIVGAGIGGLTLARALDRRGIRPDIVEVASHLEPVGAGIGLGGNAIAVYRELDLADGIMARGFRLLGGGFRDSRGRVLSRMSAADMAASVNNGADPGMLTIHRGQLHQALLAGVGGVERVQLDDTVTALDDQGSHVAVTFRSGHTADYDAVIGCDGLHSTVRTLLFGEQPLAYAGYTCWRAVVEMELEGETSERWGRGERIGLVPIGNGQVYSFLVVTAPPGAPPPWSDLDGFRQRFANFPGDPERLMNAVSDLSQLIHHDMYELPLMPAWHRGRVGLIGDAAHALTPNMGQGAAMAIEDAWVLAEELAASPTDPTAAFGRYERRRRKRVKWVQDQSRMIGKVAHWRWWLPALMRNWMVRLTPTFVTRRMLRRLMTGGPVMPR